MPAGVGLTLLQVCRRATSAGAVVTLAASGRPIRPTAIHPVPATKRPSAVERDSSMSSRRTRTRHFHPALPLVPRLPVLMLQQKLLLARLFWSNEEYGYVLRDCTAFQSLSLVFSMCIIENNWASMPTVKNHVEHPII